MWKSSHVIDNIDSKKMLKAARGVYKCFEQKKGMFFQHLLLSCLKCDNVFDDIEKSNLFFTSEWECKICSEFSSFLTDNIVYRVFHYITVCFCRFFNNTPRCCFCYHYKVNSTCLIWHTLLPYEEEIYK